MAKTTFEDGQSVCRMEFGTAAKAAEAERRLALYPEDARKDGARILLSAVRYGDTVVARLGPFDRPPADGAVEAYLSDLLFWGELRAGGLPFAGLSGAERANVRKEF
jgi:hypothetical protein